MKTYLFRAVIFISVYCFPFCQGAAQDMAMPINLETALAIGGANNLTIQEHQLRQELALANLDKANEWWLPDIYAGLSTHQLWGTAMNSDGAFFTDVNRQSFWGGLGFNASWNFGDGIYKANAEELRSEAALYQTTAEKNKALLEIINAYYDFLAAQLYYKSYEHLAEQADNIAQQIHVLVEVGIKFASDELLARSNYNHLQVEMLNARSDYYRKSAQLTRLLNYDPDIKLLSIDSVLVPIEVVSIQGLVMPFDSSYNRRPELKHQILLLASLHEERRTTTTGLWIPELRINAYSSYFGDVFAPIDPTSEINAALVWKVPLGRLISKGSLKQFDARIHLQQNQIEQTKALVNEEVLSSKDLIIVYKEQMNVAQEGSDYAELALDQCIQRQQLGTTRPFEILVAQEMFINSRLDYLKAVASYNKAQYAYYVAIGNNL